MSNNVEVFLGNSLEDPSELRLLDRLRSDLSDAGVRARIHANFMAGPTQRQIDFLIVTETRLVQAELKTVDPTRPLTGGLNGPWQQHGRDGSVKALPNYYEQARGATYALGDQLTKMAANGVVPRHPADRFVKAIDSILLFAPRIPADSKLERHKFIAAVGYDELLERLVAPGPRPPWTWPDWDAFARDLGVYAEFSETPADRQRRLTLDLVADYRHRLVAAVESDTTPYVPLPATLSGEPVDDPTPAIITELLAGGTVTVKGRSGDGKSRLCARVARQLALHGALPLLVKCGDYQPGRFPVALKRAAAQFTTEPIVEFVERATAAGLAVALLLDGLNECPPDVGKDMLLRLEEFRLRHPVAVMATSTDAVVAPTATETLKVDVLPPDFLHRELILTSRGVALTEDLLGFDNRFDLVLAAEVQADLPPGSPPVDFYDRYIERRVSERERGVLRAMALRLLEEFRSSMTATELRQLARGMSDDTGIVVDGILSCGLVDVGQGRVRLTHGRLAGFLAAEELALTSTTTDELVANLRDARYTAVASFAIASLTRAADRIQVLHALASADLYQEALQGRFRPPVADNVAGQVRAALVDAADDTSVGRITPMSLTDDEWMLQWEGPADRSPRAFALLQVAARSLRFGRFLPETLALLDATDQFMAAEARRLRAAGNMRATSAAYKALYEHGWTTRGAHQAPASSVVVDWGNLGRSALEPDQLNRLTELVWTPGTGSRHWGRLLLALRLLRFTTAVPAHAAQLLREAWEATAWHLRMDVLSTAKTLARTAEGATRDGIVEFLNDLGPLEDVSLSTFLVEALADYDQLDEPMTDADSITAAIQLLVDTPDRPDSGDGARRVLGLRWENQRIVGPYYDVIESLAPDVRLRLATLACADGQLPSVFPYLVIREIAEAAATDPDERLLVVLNYHATHLHGSSAGIQDSVAAHVEAISGLARVGTTLPDPDGDKHSVTAAWRLIDQALFTIGRGDRAPLATAEIVTRWRGHAHEIVSAFVWLESSRYVYLGEADPKDCLSDLRTACPNLVREVSELVLANPKTVVGGDGGAPNDERISLAIGQLGLIGSPDSIALIAPYLDGPHGQAAARSIRLIEARRN